MPGACQASCWAHSPPMTIFDSRGETNSRQRMGAGRDALQSVEHDTQAERLGAKRNKHLM